MRNGETAYIALGSNLGDRRKNIFDALKMLENTGGIKLVKTADIIETKPLTDNNQEMFLNTAAEITSSLSAVQLLGRISEIEKTLGRERGQKWLPRTIDIDILFYGNQVIEQGDLVVPHPQMHLRSFVLRPLCRLNPDLIHPVLNVTVSELASRLNSSSFVPVSDRPYLVSVAGLIGVGKTTLARKLSSMLDCPLLLEPYDKNPFLPEVYAGNTILALDSQLFFLLHRVEQLNKDFLEREKIYVTDYVFDKELIYANLVLNKLQLELYYKLYNKLHPEVSRPVLVIYLTDSEQNCLERIHRRNRPYEQKIELSFLRALKAGYDKLFDNWDKCPVIRIKAEKLDYKNDSFFNQLINQVKYYIDVKTT